MKNFIMCFTEEIKDKLIKEGYELLNIIDNYGDNDYFNTTTLIRKFQENYLTD